MAISKQMRLLQNKWISNAGWPKRLEWLEIKGLRGWTGNRIDFRFPIVAICGENGAGKSTILQSAAASYSSVNGRGWYASDFFPDTAWEKIEDASIVASITEGVGASISTSVRKPGTRWRGNPERRQRHVEYIDLSRIQPVSARFGYSRLSKGAVTEVDAENFEVARVARLSAIMGRNYDGAKMALTNADDKRRVPVITIPGASISGFHQGAGELTMAEFLQIDPPKYSLVLIDEVETSLHPRAQRRLIRDLADLCRQRELQIILTTHSPYILEELPPEARGYIMQPEGKKQVILGVSPEFAMTRMDEEIHPELDVYVEDTRAESMLREILIQYAPNVVSRIMLIPYGAAGVGRALGQMVSQNRFKRPSLVFLDGDQEIAPGCLLLPGEDAPERVVFEGLSAINWANLYHRLGRNFSEVADACSQAMTQPEHHDWIGGAASKLLISGDVLWQAMCFEWAANQLGAERAALIVDAVASALPQ